MQAQRSRSSEPNGGENRAPSAGGRLTMGIEEEFHLVDLSTRWPAPRATEILGRLESSPRVYAAELQQTMIETNSAVTDDLETLRGHLFAHRAELVEAAHALGVGVAAAGIIPLGGRGVPMTDTPRYQRMLADYRLLVREQVICGMQVHVGIHDREIAARLLDRVSPWLPAFLALSASSPLSHAGEDTGYASARTLIWSRWPTAGGAGPLESAAEYEALVQSLLASGIISDPKMVYFDVRPSSHVPTIEMRICDACPSVDVVALIAGLFRAVVARELARLADGRPSTAVSPPVQRAAMWRAARSGLEGELVDLSGPRSVPARVLVRAIVTGLRPELEATGDWPMVQALCDAALARGSAAGRQRERLRQRNRVEDVIDLVVAETCGDSGDRPSLVVSLPFVQHYGVDGFDEAIIDGTRLRPSHGAILETLNRFSGDELQARQDRLEKLKMDDGVAFRPVGQTAAVPFPLDLVPRALLGEEWSRIQGGAAQRARALEAFLRDAYGDQAIVRDGVLPDWVIGQSPGWMRAGQALPRDVRRAQVIGFDIVRDDDGRWLVLEDNARVPSGVAYAIEARRLLSRAIPEIFAGIELLEPGDAPALLKTALAESAPARAKSDPSIVLLTDGPNDSAYFEHRMLAREMGVPLVLPADLVAARDGVHRVEGRRRSRVDVVYLRIGEQLARRPRADQRPLGPGLVEAAAAGSVTLANALGNGVADDKAVYAYVPSFIEYYLGEKPLLEQVRTYHCADPDQQGHVLRRLEELVVKPVDGYGGLGVVIGPHASDEELARARHLILAQPDRWIAQELVSLSTHPVFEAGAFRPRHVDLRVFAYYGEEPIVVPAPLTRVAPTGSMIVNSSRGGGSKDTWLLK